MSRTRITRFVALFTLIAFLAAGCAARYVTPPPIPEKSLPTLMQDPPPQAEGMGRITFDVTDGPTEVVEITGRSSGFAVSGTATASSYGESTRHICTTPCVADLPYGSHEIRIGVDDTTVDIGVKPTAYRHSKGFVKLHWATTFWGIMGTTMGGTAALTGGLLAIAGIDAGLPIFAVGALVTVIGAVLLKKGRTVIQRGSGVQWVVE